MGIEHPFIQIKDNGKTVKVFLNDAPRLRQLYYNYKCFKNTTVRLDSLNYALKYINSRNVKYIFPNDINLRKIIIQNTKMIFIYEYCLSQASLMRLSPEKDSVVVNLHNWNGQFCISKKAYELAKHMNVRLLTM